MKTKTTVLKSVAVLGAVTAAGTVATTTAHADAANVAPAKTAVVPATNTDQQLTNLKNQQAASEAQASSANATTMSAATSAANGQIADLNSQIKQRQASDAAAHQAKVASATNEINSAATSATNAENASYSAAAAKQSAANDAELKAAQAKVVTPAQKAQQTAKENAAFQSESNKLSDEHNANVNKINTDYKAQEQAASQKIDNAKKDANDAHEKALVKATKQVDDQIKAAAKTVSDAQNTVNNDQSEVKTKQNAADKAQDAIDAAQKTLNEDQSALADAQKVLKNGNVITINKLNVPQDYINVWKEYYQNRDNYKADLAKSENSELWQRNHDASAEAKRLNADSDFVASEQDKNTPVHFNSDGTLSRNDAIIATQYAAELINPVREAIGINPYQITNASIDMNMENASKYRARGHNDWQDGHDGQLLGQIAKEWGTPLLDESLSGDWAISTKLTNKQNVSVADLKKAVYQAVVGLLFEGADGSDNGHTTDLLGVRADAYYGGNDFLGVTYDLDPVNHNGWIRFNSIKDENSPEENDKTIQGDNYTHIAVPTPESQSDAIAKLQKQINDLETKVANDTNAVKLAQNTASDVAGALKSAQDKLSQDQKTLTDAQTKLNNLKQNRDQNIKDLASDPSWDKLIKDLQDQFDTVKTNHANAIQAENDDYAAKLQDLKKKHEDKLAAIAAQPENTDALKSQLQTKLDALKKSHEVKLAAIQSDAQVKIDALKKQAVENDPEIANLQAKIAGIKANLAKQQKALDDQFAALKAKDEADYNALAQKLKNSSSEAAKGHNDHYNTSDGHKVVLPSDSGSTTPSKPATSNAGSATSSASTPASSATSAADSSAVSSHATAPASPASATHDVVYAAKGTDTAVQTSVAALVATATTTTPMTREEVKSQNEGKTLPQTGNESGILAMVFGSVAAMFGLGFAAKKRY